MRTFELQRLQFMAVVGERKVVSENWKLLSGRTVNAGVLHVDDALHLLSSVTKMVRILTRLMINLRNV